MSSSNSGLHLGHVIAAVASYMVNKSIIWAAVHGFFGWFYVIYFVLFVR